MLMTIERAVLGRLRNEAQTMDKGSLSANVVERHLCTNGTC